MLTTIYTPAIGVVWTRPYPGIITWVTMGPDYAPYCPVIFEVR